MRVTAEQYFSNLSNVAVSDATGHFSIQRLAAGSYQVLATARDGASKTVLSVTAGTRNLRVIRDRAGSIAGTLVGFHSQPSILGTLASFGQEPVDFEVEGDRFRAHGLPPGTYMITASTNGHEADNTTVVVKAGSTTPVVLSSRGSASVSGHVIDWLTKRPVANARCAPPLPLPRNGDNLGVLMRAPEIERATDASVRFTSMTSRPEKSRSRVTRKRHTGFAAPPLPQIRMRRSTSTSRPENPAGVMSGRSMEAAR